MLIRQADSRRWLMLAIIVLSAFMVTIDGFIVNVATPSIERQLEASFAEVQLVVASYTLAYAVFLVTGGRLGDLYGRKRLFVLGLAGFTLFSALCGLAPNALLLIVFRIAKGAAAALMTPQAISSIQVTFDARERPLAFGTYAAISGLASIVGQVFGGFLLTANLFDSGWRGIFLVNVPVGIVAVLGATVLLRESRVPEARGLDYGGVAWLTLSLFLLVFPLVEGAHIGWPLWAQLCLLLSVPCMIAFLVYERRMTELGKAPLVSLALFRQTRFPAGIITIALAVALVASLLFVFAFYVQETLQLTPLQAGAAFLPSSISFVLASSISPVVVARLGRRSLSVTAALVTLGYLIVLLSAQFLVPRWGLPPLMLGLVAIGLGMGSLGTPLMHWTLEGVAPQDAGMAAGIYTTATQLGSAFGVALIGLIYGVVSGGSGAAPQAFVASMLAITLLSLGLSVTVLPLVKPIASRPAGGVS
ncbi:MAG TPA: MFS transporter [Chloroflexota bacterium]|nr:MFS transporter [Chloroflexota bacterium]